MSNDTHRVTAGSVHLREDGIVHFVCAEAADLDAENTRELFAMYRTLGGDVPLKILSDIRGMRSSTPESRALATTEEATSLHAAAAVIVGSKLTRMMGNLFMRLNRPAYPTRLFDDADSAVAWLHSLPGHERSEAG
jgi:hypothetical protein